VAAERAGYLRLVPALPSERGEHIPLLGGELSIRHAETSSWRLKSSSVSRLTSITGKLVASLSQNY
jgi:hypothetical protein